jgi:hypothetical protein
VGNTPDPAAMSGIQFLFCCHFSMIVPRGTIRFAPWLTAPIVPRRTLHHEVALRFHNPVF